MGLVQDFYHQRYLRGLSLVSAVVSGFLPKSAHQILNSEQGLQRAATKSKLLKQNHRYSLVSSTHDLGIHTKHTSTVVINNSSLLNINYQLLVSNRY